jgi:hypothetical protein
MGCEKYFLFDRANGNFYALLRTIANTGGAMADYDALKKSVRELGEKPRDVDSIKTWFHNLP